MKKEVEEARQSGKRESAKMAVKEWEEKVKTLNEIMERSSKETQ